MQMLLFRSLDTVIDIDDLFRCAFNHAFSELDLNWHWSKECFTRLSTIAGDRHRISWYAEHIAGKRITCGLADRIYWRKERAVRQLLDNDQARPRPGILRLLNEAERASVQSVLCIEESMLEKNIITHARKNLHGFLNLEINERTSRRHYTPPNYRRRQTQDGNRPAPVATTISLVNSGQGCDSIYALGLQYSNLKKTIPLSTDKTAHRACISHLGDKGNPATHLAGQNVLQKGIASLSSLAALEGTTMLSRVA